MALRKPNPNDQAAAAGAATEPTIPVGRFEDMSDDTTSQPAANETSSPAPAPAPSAAAPTAPAKPASTAVAVPRQGGLSLSSGTTLKGLQNSIAQQDLEAMGFGVFPRITVNLDGFVVDKNKKELGKKIKVEVLSWNYVWLVTTGEQNDAEANKLIRSSYDGVNLMNGEGAVADYVKWLKSQDYDKSGVKQYVEVYANLLAYQQEKDEQTKWVEVPADEQSICQVSLSPQSVGQWGRYMLESGLRKARGIEDSAVVVMTRQKKTLGPNTFAYAEFSTK